MLNFWPFDQLNEEFFDKTTLHELLKPILRNLEWGHINVVHGRILFAIILKPDHSPILLQQQAKVYVHQPTSNF